MDKIIGRKREKEELLHLYESGRPEFVAIYGRRRVGKTFLVKELFKQNLSFYHTGLSPYDTSRRITARKQIEAFYASMFNFGLDEKACPQTWMEAFRMLGQLLDSQSDGTSRQLIFIDELPWMDTPRSNFLGALEYFWNSWCAWRDNVMLIVCGSATSWMLDNLINNKGGLYDRITWQIKLSPFTLAECRHFFEMKQIPMSDYSLTETYMILGGVPYYLNYFRNGKSTAQNIDILFFDKNAKLKDEFKRLFASLFINPDDYITIIKLLAYQHNGFTRDELANKLGVKSGGSLTKMLEALIASDFIVSYYPFGQHKILKYKLCDCFCRFYVHFIEGKTSIEPDFWQHNVNSPSINNWKGYMFEQVCFNHVDQIKQALGISGVSSEEAEWIVRGDNNEPGTQVDMLIIRKDNIVNLCEMKFLTREYAPNLDDENTLRKRIALLQEKISFNQTIHLTLVTTAGLKQNAHSGIFQNVITLNQLIKD